ncbi:vitamin B12-dependent ribonucleotide reductase [Patescibacteria group bacterium]|nr:vitamin B12-dependent ribonucleotide reductase [Patescibacteria group bacterium]
MYKVVGKRLSLPKDLAKGEWTKQSLKVLNERYLRKDKNGKVTETPEDLCWRVSWDIASAESIYGKKKKEIKETAKEFYKLLVAHEFLPNSPTLMNAGIGNRLQYSGCYVIPIEDSLVGIFDALKNQALIHQTGGGTGFSFSRLRPRGSIVKSSMGIASGPISFMRIFDSATNEIKQGGKRRGANMGILRVDHPDIQEFIHCKEDGGITNFNISVAITDKFMEAYKKNSEYDLLSPKDGQKVKTLKARDVFNDIAQLAWKTGDPGLVFIDKINQGSANPVPSLGPIESTNPCGEQPLYPNDSCNLGSIFLTYFVKEENGEKQVDWEKLKRVTKLAVRFLDDVIDVNPYTVDEIRKTTLAIRRIGLGIGGWADLLIKLGIAYDSDEALLLAEKVMKTIQNSAVEESQDLAKERGSFPMWSKSMYKNQKPRRNSTLTTIAPTGSISIIAGASSGIEPLFALAFQHIVKDKSLDRKLTFINPYFEEYVKDKDFWTESLKERVLASGIIRHIFQIPEEIRNIFGTAHEIDPKWHIKTQVAFQKYTENAVSKTINLNHTATVEDVKKAYLLAWDLGCKGTTIFRDGSKSSQVLNLGVKNNENKNGNNEVNEVKEGGVNSSQEILLKRPHVMKGSTYKLITPVGTAFITINEDGNYNPMELFINVGKAGSDVQAMAEALGRTISSSLRFGSNLSHKQKIKEIAEQLSGIGGRRSVGFGLNKIRSLPDAVSIAISKHYGFKINGNSIKASSGMVKTADPALSSTEVKLKDHTVVSAVAEGVLGDICPSCGFSTFVYQEGCAKCMSCGYSEC